MNTTYRITSRKGQTLATVAKSEDGSHWAEIKAIVEANPGAEVKPVVTLTSRCEAHPAFEPDNCPSCGTSRMSF